MTRFRWLLYALLLVTFLGKEANANTLNAASCNLSDVQAAINSAAEGDTVTIPSGTCVWTSGVTISGKGITIQGAGSGRIIAYDNGAEVLTVGTGTQTVNIAGYSPGFSSSSITPGETLRIFENNAQTNWMQGTVTSLNGSVLTMNVNSTGGSGNTHRWLISTIPSTIIINNSGSTLFSITEDTSVHTNWSGIQVVPGTGTGQILSLSYQPGGQAILIHDCWIQQGWSESINSSTNRGVVWNCSFSGSTGNPGQLITTAALRVKIDTPATGQISWTGPSFWGATDTTGTNNFYFESNDVHAYQAASDNDDNGRLVWRYNLMDHSEFSTHGADTSDYGERYFEYYNNTGVFYGYSDGSTFNIANGWIGLVRGGTFVVHDNTLPSLQSQDYGTKADINMTVMNLQRNAGPDPCWGTGTSSGSDYSAPRQVGKGYVTGNGHDGSGRTSDSVTYVGDSEPAYIWNNSRVPLGNIALTNYGTGNANSCSGSTDSTANYIISNRDFFNGSTAKPGYTPYTYPHPLTNGQSTGNGPAPPTNLSATVL
jgi:hypothetical protein